MLSNVINWFSVTAVDCSLQVFVFVSASYTVYGKSKALVPVTKYSAHYLAALGFYGVLQNCVVTIALPTEVHGVSCTACPEHP